ncbi:hypothetical protein [Bacteroides gallinarum]|uniref:hypothetical protein n=1 Tax=Bacteroides gallinarum TaxID=376806 RepID=UPI00047590D3|nr:hypothetical protein [Bacteroides gallinarum]
MRTRDNGLANLHDANHRERGFCCMKLIAFLIADGVKAWEEWHGEHLNAARGQCRYRARCPIYKRSKTNIEQV